MIAVPPTLRAAIMQPYFLPYIGYFQLIAAADVFVCYDNIKYTKKGWINRNRILRDDRDVHISLPLEAASDHCEIRERRLAADFDAAKLANRIREAYRRAPQFEPTFALLEGVLACRSRNLFEFLLHSISATCAHLGINTPICVSSNIPIDHDLRAQHKVIAICRALGATDYVNPIGGVELYDMPTFAAASLSLRFLKTDSIRYRQWDDEFVPSLSIVDVLMFNPLEVVRGWVRGGYRLVAGGAASAGEHCDVPLA